MEKKPRFGYGAVFILPVDNLVLTFEFFFAKIGFKRKRKKPILI
jgi:UDP-N-acetylglucosamine pyrophosphorylase